MSTRIALISAGAVTVVLAVILGFLALKDPTDAARQAYHKDQARAAQTARPTPEDIHGAEPAPSKPARNAKDVDPDGATIPRDDLLLPPAEPEISLGGPAPEPAFPAPPPSLPQNAPPVPESLVQQGVPSAGFRSTGAAPAPVVETEQNAYMFNNLLPSALGAQSMVLVTAEAKSAVNPQAFAPEGEMIELALLDNFISSTTGEIPVVAAVWSPFYFNGRKLLDVGDKLIGSASKGKQRDRVMVKFTKIIFLREGGKSVAVDAVALAPDGTYGVPGYKVGNVLLDNLVPILFDLSTSFAEALENRLATSTSLGFLGASDNQNIGTQNIMTGNGGGQVLQTVEKMMAEDMEENRPYLVIPAGTRCRAYLTRYIDVSRKDFGK